jgi:hypothetical protein
VSADEELKAELLKRAERDQAARTSLTPGHEMAEWAAVVAPVDRDNTARLREIVAAHGWPGHRLVSEAGAHAAWLLVQHAPTDLQEECLPLLEDAVTQGDASPVDLAYLKDRVLMHRGEPQIYGTQYRVRDGVPELWTVRDPAGLDERRAALGLEPEAENRARLLARRARLSVARIRSAGSMPFSQVIRDALPRSRDAGLLRATQLAAIIVKHFIST